MELRRGGRNSVTDLKQVTLEKLRDLSLSFDLEESAVVQTNSRRNAMDGDRDDDESVMSTYKSGTGKRVILDGEESSENRRPDEYKDDEWNLSHDIPSGKLPATYKKYVLVRPYPSLRIIFASQTAKKVGDLVQHHFLSHIAAPATTLSGLKDTFETMTPVTAKVAMMAQPGQDRDGTATGKWGRDGDHPEKYGRSCWISATPLFDSEGAAGVWMIVIVDDATRRDNDIVTMDTNLTRGDLPVMQSNGYTEAEYSPQTLFQLQQQKAQNNAVVKPKGGGHAAMNHISAQEEGTRVLAVDFYGHSAGSGATASSQDIASSHRSESHGADDLYMEANSSTECLNGSLIHDGLSHTDGEQGQYQ